MNKYMDAMSIEIVNLWVNNPVLFKQAAQIGIHEYLSEQEMIEAYTFATIACRGGLTENDIESMRTGGEGAQIVFAWLISQMPALVANPPIEAEPEALTPEPTADLF